MRTLKGLARPLAFGLAVSGSLLGTGAEAAPPGYSLVWSDEFAQAAGSQPSGAVWNYDLGAGGWGNGELETYVDSASACHVVADLGAVDGKALQIEAKTDGQGGYTSARIHTKGKIVPQYGFIEARLKLPYSQAMWPAFWMLGSSLSTAGWPKCGELDIMESLGSAPAVAYGSFHASGWDAGASYTNPGGRWFSDTYHLFQCFWTPNCISYAIDDVVYETRTINDTTGEWPFNAPMFFILNLAVGGYWPGYPDQTTVTPMDYLIDYVRVYRLSGVPTGRLVSLFSLTNSKFVCADNYGQSSLVPNRTVAQGWEQFRVIDRGGGCVALQSLANGRYVSVTRSGAGPLIASSATIGILQTFHWEPSAYGTVALRSLANSRYVCADAGAGSPPLLIAKSSTVTARESFGVTCYLDAASSPKNPAPFGQAPAAQPLGAGAP